MRSKLFEISAEWEYRGNCWAGGLITVVRGYFVPVLMELEFSVGNRICVVGLGLEIMVFLD